MIKIKEQLLELCAGFYDEKQLSFSIALFDLAVKLKLDEISAATAFFINAQLNNTELFAKLQKKFGSDFTQKIAHLQRIGKLSLRVNSKDSLRYRKAFIELADDIKIIIVKLAERLVSLRFADTASSDDLNELAEECLHFYAPVAQMLGIRQIYNEMEDISFRVLFPKDFNFLKKRISEKEAVFESKLNSMKNELLRLLEENKIPARLQYRIKRPYSIYRKLKNKKISLEEIYDLLALRVITQSHENCYLTLGLVHSKWVPIEGRFRDWISYPKSNGYRSIQTTVHTRKGEKFEIQIRTEEMHEEAEFGSSAHWAYKQGNAVAGKSSWIKNLREFLDNEEYIENPFQFFESLKTEMKRSYINVLTPKGEIVSLPEGSTPLDFAFEVHTDLGYRTTGAKVNGKFVKLKTELKSGDIVDIISISSATPSRDWLNIVKTTRARSKILRWFKKNEKDLYIIQGRNQWEKLKEQHRKKLVKFEDEQKVKAQILKLGYKNTDDFFFAISNGAVKCSLFLLKKIYPDAFKAAEKEKRKSGISGKQLLPKVRVEGLTMLDIQFAKCCNPIKGEKITAYITSKSALKIHSSECSVIAAGKLNKSNLKSAEWLTDESLQTIKCRLYGVSASRMLASSVTAADSTGISIISSGRITGKSKLDCLELSLEVKDISAFNKFVSAVRSHGDAESVRVV